MSSTRLDKLPIPPSLLDRLEAAEFQTVGDLDGFTPADLAEELDVDMECATAALDIVRGDRGTTSSSAAAPVRDALSLLNEERSTRRIVTFAREVDMLLGGGVPLRQLTEFSGVPGVGKTQLAMQLALTVQLPTALDGLDGEAVYIDTEGSFYAPRCLAMAEALISRLRSRPQNSPEQHAAAGRMEPRAMLERITYLRVHDATEQLAAIRMLSELATANASAHAPRVRLVIIDSIAFHVRHADVTYSRRLELLGKMAQVLSTAAQQHGLAVVLINQMTTRVNDALGTSSLVPALGDSWAHVCNVQVSLQWRDGRRLAVLYKGLAPGEAEYRVTSEGIRSAAESAKSAESAETAERRGWRTSTASAVAGAAALMPPPRMPPMPMPPPPTAPTSHGHGREAGAVVMPEAGAAGGGQPRMKRAYDGSAAGSSVDGAVNVENQPQQRPWRG